MFNFKYVGLDIGSGLVKIFCQGQVYELQTPEKAITNGIIANTEELSQIIGALVLEKKLRGKQTVISYNGPSVFTKVIKIPLMGDKEIQNYLSLETDSIVPFPADEGVTDYIELKRDLQKKEMEVLIIALKHELIMPYIKAVKDSGLVPVAIDIPALAISRVLFNEYQQDLQLIIDIGKSSTDIHIYSDSIFRFSRSIALGGDDFDNILSASLGIDPKKALADRISNSYEKMIFKGIFMDLQRELNRSIDYFKYRFGNQQNRSFTKVYLIGGNNHIKGLNETVHEITEIEPIVIENSRSVIARGLEKWRDRA